MENFWSHIFLFKANKFSFGHYYLWKKKEGVEIIPTICSRHIWEKRSILYNICVYMYMCLCIYIDTCVISTAYNWRIKDTVISDQTMSELSSNAPLYRCAGDTRYALSERGSEWFGRFRGQWFLIPNTDINENTLQVGCSCLFQENSSDTS